MIQARGQETRHISQRAKKGTVQWVNCFLIIYYTILSLLRHRTDLMQGRNQMDRRRKGHQMQIRAKSQRNLDFYYYLFSLNIKQSTSVKYFLKKTPLMGVFSQIFSSGVLKVNPQTSSQRIRDKMARAKSRENPHRPDNSPRANTTQKQCPNRNSWE